MNKIVSVKPDWPAPKSIKALTTTRLGGYSASPFESLNLGSMVDDEIEAVEKNRALLEQELALPQAPVWLKQVHSTIVLDAATCGPTPTADASFSKQAGIVCAVLTADCLPLLICNKQGTLVCAIHAGWRGLADGIIEQSIAALNCPPEDLLVWLGPAIGPNAFEVGEDVLAAFTAQDPQANKAFIPNNNERWLANLYLLATLRLNKLGITHIYGGNHCTYTESTHFYSFRRDKRCGRMASLIWME